MSHFKKLAVLDVSRSKCPIVVKVMRLSLIHDILYIHVFLTNFGDDVVASLFFITQSHQTFAIVESYGIEQLVRCAHTL
jgi:hypothetical protein